MVASSNIDVCMEYSAERVKEMEKLLTAILGLSARTYS